MFDGFKIDQPYPIPEEELTSNEFEQDGMTQCCNVYTDGSFKHSRGGFGVYVNDDRGRRTSLCGPVSNKKTNNTAELTAVIKAVDFCKTNISRPVRIFTDSSYVILSLTKLKRSNAE